MQAVREFRPHVILTYDENGGYPHPDHIKTHQVAVEAFEAAGDPDRYPGCGEPWQPLKLYYFLTFHRARITGAARGDARAAAWSRPTRSGSSSGRTTTSRAAPGAQITTQVPCGEYFEIRDQALLAHATQVDPDGPLVRLPDGDAARGLADRGLSAGQVGGGYWVAGGRPVRRDPGEGELVIVLAAASPSAFDQPGTLGFLVVFGMAVILYFVFRSMAKHLRRVNQAAADRARPRAPDAGVTTASRADDGPGEG